LADQRGLRLRLDEDTRAGNKGSDELILVAVFDAQEYLCLLER